MAWGTFTLALLITFVAQTALVQPLAPTWLDLLTTLALVYGLTAPVAEARLAGWTTGLAQDIGGSGPLGAHALALGLMILALTWLRGQVNLELWWGRWLIALVAALPARLLVHLHERLVQGSSLSWGGILSASIVTAVSASLLASLVLLLPERLGRRRRRPLSRW